MQLHFVVAQGSKDPMPVELRYFQVINDHSGAEEW